MQEKRRILRYSPNAGAMERRNVFHGLFASQFVLAHMIA